MKEEKDGFAEIVIDGDARQSGGGYSVPSRGKYTGKGAYPPRYSKAEEQLCFEYDAELPFIKKVQVYSWGAKHSFYERFREDAERYSKMTGHPCEEVPFFSYTPQYSQLNLYQSNFYLYFRELVRRGEYIHADLPYILLYVYELINLIDISNPEEDIKLLCGIWMGYRDFYPVLDKYMAEWVCDYCLFCRLPVPRCVLEILPKLCETATLREFYMSAAIESGTAIRGEVLEAFADYDYRRSRVEIAPEYLHHFRRALEEACRIFPKEYFVADAPTVVKRDAFCGSLCSHNVKRKIAVEYYPAFRRSGVRAMLGGAVKHIENKLRRAMGVRSRLHTDGLPDTVRAEIDRYFEREMPEIFARNAARVEPTPEYERYYDAPPIPFSADAAEKIERESRAAAELLADFDDTDDTPAIADKTDTSAITDTAGTVGTNKDAIRHILEGGSLEEWCRERSLLPDTVAGEINEAAMDFYGDALLEHDGSSWQIITDYLEEAAELAVE